MSYPDLPAGSVGSEADLEALIKGLTSPANKWQPAGYDPERDAILADNISVNHMAMDVKEWFSRYRQTGDDWHKYSPMQLKKLIALKAEEGDAVAAAAYAVMLSVIEPKRVTG